MGRWKSQLYAKQSHLLILFCQVLAYYISFLKTLSLKLNRHTVHFFFNEVSDHLNLFNSQAWNKCNKLIFNSKSIIFSLKDRPTMQIDCSSAPNVLPLFLEKKKWMEKKFKLIFFYNVQQFWAWNIIHSHRWPYLQSYQHGPF